MSRKGTVWLVSLTTVLVGAGGYGVADAYDYVPGVLTLEPEPVPPAAFASHQVIEPGAVPAAPVSALGDAAPLPDADIVQALAQQLRDDRRTGVSTNVAVVDVLTGEVLADLGADDPQVPASTTKTLTAVAALSALGSDFTTRTTVTWDESAAQLTLVAGGDMMLAAGQGHGGELRQANGWAGLGDLAEQVALAVDADERDVTVVVDDTDFIGPAINPEWPAYALSMGYVAPVTGIAVNVAKKEDEPYAQRFTDPSIAAANDLVVQLEERGFTVTRVSSGTSPADAVEVAAVESAPLALVAEYLLHVSDNSVAENIGRILATETGWDGTPAGSAAATIAQLDSLGVDTEGLALYDGAGYSTRNRISPFHLTDAMLAAGDDPGARWLLDYLPIAGVEGTMAERYEDSASAGVLRAKTGSLTGVTSLAGTVQTADGRVLAFALLADGMPYGQDNPRAAFDEFLAALTECGCRE